MRNVELFRVADKVKIGEACPNIIPNITDDCYFVFEGEVIGFYIKKINDKESKYLRIANYEFNSNRVPKSEMSRGPQGSKKQVRIRELLGEKRVVQKSAIIGGMAKKPHFSRPYPNISALHGVESARAFIASMKMLMLEAEKTLRKHMPEQYDKQKELVSGSVKKRFRIGDLFTSAICNYNISAAYHKDTGNIGGTVNFIYTKRLASSGGNLHVPEFKACIDQKDESLLVYPAWMSVHGVTPIITDTGYRNSFVFYPLNIK